MEKHHLRTLNVNKSVEGITDDITVNIAYRTAPGLTYQEAKDFERKLQLEIQAVLNTLSFTTPQEIDSNIRFIPLNEAMKITNHGSDQGFYKWRLRHNEKHPTHAIILQRGCIELNSLKRALTVYSGEAAA